MLAVAMIATACADDNTFSPTGEEQVRVRLTATLDQGNASRAGEAPTTDVNKLYYTVYKVNKDGKPTTITGDTASIENGVVIGNTDITLVKNQVYKFVFFAQNANKQLISGLEGGPYPVLNTLDYTQLAGDKDAFYGVIDQQVQSSGNVSVTMKRPFTQLNFYTTAESLESDTMTVTFNEPLYKSFNLLTGNVVDESDANEIVTSVDLEDVTETINGVDVRRFAKFYVLAPATTGTTSNNENDNERVISFKLDNIDKEYSSIVIPFIQNYCVRIAGNVVEAMPWSEWDGKTRTTLTCDEQDRYVIDEASDIAWLCENTNSLVENKTFVLTRDINMGNKDGLSSINLPNGSTIEGDNHTIKGVRIAGALFGDATNITINNLNLEDIIVGASQARNSNVTHAGLLVNTLKGSSSFSNVTISNSSVATTNGAAGGMVGYIARVNEKERSETLAVSFTGCKLNGVSVSGSTSEGKFVGLLSGYDNNESLSFDAECDATEVSVSDYTSIYVKANNSAWVDGDVTEKYDGWLGAENYRRAKVTFGGVRLAPRWDGKTVTAKAELLLYNGENNKYEVYSPFDLAGVRNATASPSAIYLKNDIDMNGQGADGEYFVHEKFTQSKNASTDDNKFNAFSSIALLEGNNKGIYNLALNANGSDRYAFILSGNNGDIHRNTSFHNCCTVVPHVVGTDNGQTVDKSYGATVVLSVGGATYTMDNVHAYGCKVFALQKTAILAGRLVSSTKATINNCSVNDCYIENYKCEEHKEIFEESIVSAEFYSYGEIGSITGFINYNATITNCNVTNTTICAYGQKDQKGNIANGIKAGTIPGRHINQFIGDIRSKKGYTVSISDCSVSGNKYEQDNHSHSKGTSIPIIGEAYCLGAKIIFIQKGDEKGTVKVKNINIDGNKKFTSETSVTLQELM